MPEREGLPVIVRPAQMGDVDGEHDEVEPAALVCPWHDCGAENSIVEVDQAIRWNTVERLTVLPSGGFEVIWSLGKDHDWEWARFICSSCLQPVSFPENYRGVDWV